MKICPQCAEERHDAETTCSACGSILESSSTSKPDRPAVEPLELEQPKQAKGRPRFLVFSVFAALLALVLAIVMVVRRPSSKPRASEQTSVIPTTTTAPSTDTVPTQETYADVERVANRIDPMLRQVWIDPMKWMAMGYNLKQQFTESAAYGLARNYGKPVRVHIINMRTGEELASYDESIGFEVKRK